MNRVTSRVVKTLASALVASVAITLAPIATAYAVDDLVIDPRAAAITAAQQPSDLQQALSATAAQPEEPKVVKADFWKRTSEAIRATRSVSALRYGTPAYAKWYAREHVKRVYNWDSKQFGCLVSLWTKESSWRYTAVSKNKKWHGIPQATKLVVTGLGYSLKNYMRAPELQVQVGARYINYRYGSPCAAWKHSQRKGWY